MGRIKCKQATSFYALQCINQQERAGVHSLTLYRQFGHLIITHQQDYCRP